MTAASAAAAGDQVRHGEGCVVHETEQHADPDQDEHGDGEVDGLHLAPPLDRADLGLHGMQALSQVSIWTLFTLFAIFTTSDIRIVSAPGRHLTMRLRALELTTSAR